MNESTNSATPVNAEQQAQLDLLHAVLAESSWPWQPYSPATAQYLDRLEQDAVSEIEDEVEQSSQWASVSALAASLWETPETSLLTTLTQKFGTRMPQQLLSQLASQAQAAAMSGQALIDQMVATTHAILTDLATADLQVMARPMALAMRSSEASPVDTVVDSIRPVAWDDLSSVEQARLSLAIARYALAELDADN